MGLYYKVPEDFDRLVYMGLVLQGVGVRQGLEAHRRNRPYCMGTLYWQLNDSWPVVSWSSIDYYGNWKALHYQAKELCSGIGRCCQGRGGFEYLCYVGQAGSG